jgi:23S rRNA pseudouridine955/2504/2580 synthase
MAGVEHRTVAAGEAGLRLDRWFRRHFPEITHVRLERWLRLGHVRIDGARARAGDRVAAGQVVRIPPRPDHNAETHVSAGANAVPAAGEALARAAAALRSRILHIDQRVIALDKPAGLAVQGGSKVRLHLDAMLKQLAEGGERLRLVHRLDRDTSGVILLARTAAAAAELTSAFRSKAVRKLYWAIVAGVPYPMQGRLDLPLAKRGVAGEERMHVDPDEGDRAVTLYRTVARAGNRAAWLAFSPLTGRTHQLRAHAAALGTPILGDHKYGGAAAVLPGAGLDRRLHLHARRLVWPDAEHGSMSAVAPLPPELLATWSFFGFAPDHPGASDPW